VAHSSGALALSETTILEITRPLALTSAAPEPPKDFYIGLGQHDGVKVGDIFEVSRQVPVLNALSGLPDHVMKVVLGEIRVIATGDFDSVARVEKIRPPEEVPALEPSSFAVGDEVRLKSGLPFR
jgi:hypothetical protein